MAESPRAKPAETVATGEPPQSPVERVTEKKAKDRKKVAAGRAGAAARTAAEKRLLEAKESLRPGDGTSASIPPQEADRERSGERPEHNHNWIPWIIGACLAGGGGGGSLAYISRNMRLRTSPSSVAAGPAPKVQDKPPQLKACPDPHYMK